MGNRITTTTETKNRETPQRVSLSSLRHTEHAGHKSADDAAHIGNLGEQFDECDHEDESNRFEHNAER